MSKSKASQLNAAPKNATLKAPIESGKPAPGLTAAERPIVAKIMIDQMVEPDGNGGKTPLAALARIARHAMMTVANHPDCSKHLSSTLSSAECDLENECNPEDVDLYPSADEPYDYTAEAERLAQICANYPLNEDDKREYENYGRMLRRASTEGQVWTPERVRQLYPIIREINDEIDRAEAEQVFFYRLEQAKKAVNG